MSTEIRRATHDDLPGILRLLRLDLGWPADERAQRLWDWKHVQNPFGASHVWVGLEDTEVVAVRTFMRWQLREPDGGLVQAARAVDTVTDRDHRARGWFRRLTERSMDSLGADGVTVLFNTPNAQSAPANLSLGWSDQPRPSVWFRPSRLRSLPVVLRSRASAGLWPAETAVGLVPASAFSSPDVIAAATSTRSGPLDVLETDRSLAFLQWRYGLPELGYRVVLGAGEGVDSVAMVRTRQRGPGRERVVLDVAGGPGALANALSDPDNFDFAIWVGHRPARGWYRVPGGGPRLVARRMDGGSVDQRFALGLGDLELF